MPKDFFHVGMSGTLHMSFVGQHEAGQINVVRYGMGFAQGGSSIPVYTEGRFKVVGTDYPVISYSYWKTFERNTIRLICICIKVKAS